MLRRDFIYLGFSATSAMALPDGLGIHRPMSSNRLNEPIKFGIVADVHKDLVPDANQRLEKFISEALARRVDFIIQLGDFCMADPRNSDFMQIWRMFNGPRYHVLGNHDMDLNSKEEMLEYWEMLATHYSFDFGGFHFVVLDANFLYQDGKFIDYNKSNFYVDSRFRTYINNEQIEWLKADLETSLLPTIIFSHQSLWHYQAGVKNRLQIQKLLEAHRGKLICCMNGHDHIDFHHYQNGVHYLEINSMSYQWMEDRYRSMDRYPKDWYEKYKWLPNLATYRDPLFAFAELKPEGHLQIEGVRSDWVTPSPFDLGMIQGVLGNEISPNISDYQLSFTPTEK